MPLFIFLSGYFSRKKNKSDFWSSIWKFFEPLIIFQIIALLFYVDNVSIRSMFTPWYVLWYLLSLIYWRLMLQIIPDKILKHKKMVIVSMFCISLLVGFIPLGRILSIQRTLSLMPFFFLGYYMRGKNLYLPDKYKPHCMVFLIMMFAIPLFFPQYIGNLKHADPYGSIYGAAIRMIDFSLAIPMSIAFINVCYNTTWMARQGRMTMQYYICHALIIPLVMMVVRKLDIPMSFATATGITIGIVIGICLILKIPYVKRLTNPSLFFAKKKFI